MGGAGRAAGVAMGSGETRWIARRTVVTASHEIRARNRTVPLVALLIVLVSIIAVASGAGVPFRNDFAAYWPVGRLLLTGQNPYDAAAIEALQRTVGDTLGGDSVVRYPPWTLPVLLPFATLPYVPGWYVWIVLQATLVGVSAAWLWRLLGGADRPWIPLVAAFGFPAGLFVALGGQIDGFLLLCVSLFLWGVLSERDLLAGSFLGLMTLKPHLFLPLGLVVLLWSVRERRWGVPAAATFTIVAGTVLALAFRPTIFQDFLGLLSAPDTSWRRAVAVGTAASAALGSDARWLPWAPAAVVAFLVVALWARFGERFDWRHDLPAVLALGLVAAPYLLVHDLVLLVPALLTMALCVIERQSVRAIRVSALGFAVLCIVMWTGQIAEGTLSLHVWVAPIMLFLAVAASICVANRPAGSIVRE